MEQKDGCPSGQIRRGNECLPEDREIEKIKTEELQIRIVMGGFTLHEFFNINVPLDEIEYNKARNKIIEKIKAGDYWV